MLARLSNWLDHRSGYRRIIDALLIEHIPGGAKWRYVWGSCLAFVFSVQLLTGVLLMTAYSPGSSTAWSSVYFIQYEMDFGWLIRGLHHFGSQTMVVLLGLHILQVVIAGAQLPPRELNWWLGLGLLSTVLGLSLTGYLLPWDQKGFWATQVATNIAGNLPGLGPWLQKIVVGGPEYGNHTLTRFYALHVGVLPPLTILLIILHLAVFRRHGVTHPPNATGEGWFWPDQAFRDMVASLVIFGVMLGLVVYGHGHKIESPAPPSENTQAEAPGFYNRLAHAGREGRGANLDAPADPATEQYPARPEWYFLFLFQLLKYFKGSDEIIGTVVIPNAVLGLLILLPLVGYGPMRKFGHAVGLLVVVSILAGAAFLTYEAFEADRRNKDFREAREKADQLGERAVNLASEGIPEGGAIYLLRHDPRTQGLKLFERNCGVCHAYEGIKNDKPTASDLTNFGSKEWVRGLLQEPGSPKYFGHTKLKGMAGWVKRTRDKANKAGKEQQLDAELDAVADWLSEHPKEDPPADEKDARPFAVGYRAFENAECASCHNYKGQGGGTAPDLAGYGGADWLRLMIMAPYHESRYGARNAMPAFRNLEGPEGEVTRLSIDPNVTVVQLSDIDREIIIRWLLKDNRVVFGGDPIAAAPKR